MDMTAKEGMAGKPKTKPVSVTAIVLFALVFVFGLAVLLYPTISNWWNTRQTARVIARYTEAVETIDSEQRETLRREAQAYNQSLHKEPYRWHPNAERHERYLAQLNVSGDGVMGFVEIPRIKVSLPISHGADMETLQNAIGHYEGSSLPVGGLGTHTVLSGHRGLPSAVLFSDLDAMRKGDFFFIHVLGEVLAYEVDEIQVVEPVNFEPFALDPERDLATLFTCTPYGINTHRLLVRGVRVELETVNPDITAEAGRASAAFIVPIAILLILIALTAWLFMRKAKKRKHRLGNEKTGNETGVGEEEV